MTTGQIVRFLICIPIGGEQVETILAEAIDDPATWRRYVRGNYETFPLGRDATGVVNADGIALGHPPNRVATELVNQHNPFLLGERDFVHGVMIVFGALDAHGRVDGEFHDVPDAIANRFKKGPRAA